ncbi:HAUS augmin-like complex subunit 7 isoform X1 [Heteronotia binoei]|uniref:HAUS augmin-like complex subunit 7 isoform X1 n=1 Tax=Heteronotia binoei TaxID=13085 RepID=UPI00292D8E1D|nr:HAUS augmin-like complex subunit 7 isoform X1 [Heteronotia binoei]
MAAVALYELLERLGCPALEGVFLSKPEDIQRLLCSPSPHRLDILEWICVSVYPPLQDQFSSLKESQTDMKIKDMAKLGSDLMLCRVDDLDLIEGKASVEKQLCFLSRLVAVIPTRESIEISDSGSFSSTFSSQDESFREMVRKNERFLKEVFCSPNLQAVLSPESQPWSSDINSLLLREEALQKRSRLPVASHERTLLEVSKELEETAAALQELRSQCSFLSGNPDGTEQPLDSATALQTLKLAVSDFGQLLVAFEQVYESEWKRHCERPAPRLSPCGPLFKAVQRDLSLSIQELTSLAQVMETSENIVTVVDRQQEEKLAWRGSAKATLPSKLEELQRKYKAIRATLHKLSNTEATVSL